MRTPNLSRAQAEFADLPAGANAHRYISEALERARVVGVLDAWAKGAKALEWGVTDCTEQACCTLQVTHAGGAVKDTDFYGATADAARAAAAKAIEAGEV